MGRVLRFLKWAARSKPSATKLRRNTIGPSSYRRQLLCEALEARALLSASLQIPAVSQLASLLPKSSSVVSSPSHPSGSSISYQSAAPAGLTPNQIRGAYGLGSYTSGVLANGVLFGAIQGDGRGQTIAVVDAYDYPTALNDLNVFSAYYGLPVFNGSGDPTFEKLNQTGGTSLPGTDPAGPSDNDWESEEAMDIEWAHAIAPMANIILFEAINDSNAGSNLFTAAQTAADTPGVVAVSMSWGIDESTYTASQVLTYDSTVFATPSGHIGGSATLGGTGLPGGVTFLAAAGDNGPYSVNGTNTIAPQYPATSPNVVAVGGTSLTVNGSSPNYTYGGETAWGSGTNSWQTGGGGGGISAYEGQPSYQSGVVSAFSTTRRTYPDVSADANPSSGVPIYDSYDGGPSTPWSTFNGGTSLSCPIWAGIIAIADEGRAIAGQGSLDGRTQTLPELYKLPAADFHDITSGSTGYAASPGYDLATGIGSPVANMLIPGLVAYQPTVTGISPVSGYTTGGTSVTITGTGFAGETAVDFGTIAATSVIVNSATQITAISPAETAGSVDVTVTSFGGTSTTSSVDKFTYVVPPPSFTLTGPTSGTFAGGQTVSIQWTAGNVDSGSTISLAYDTTTNWGNPTWIEIGGVTATNGTGSYNWNTSGIAAGTYYLAGYLYDAGKACFSHLTSPDTITYAAPRFALAGPTSGTFTAGQTVSIQWTAANVTTGSTISLAYDTSNTWANPKWIEIGAVSAANGTATYNWNTTGVAAGYYCLAGYLYDAGQAYFSHLGAAITIAAAAATPSFGLTGPLSGTFTAGQTVSIRWAAANVAAGSTISLAYDTTTNWGNPTWIDVGGVSAASGEGSYNWNTSSIAAGTYYLAGYLYDAGKAYYSHLGTAITIASAAALPSFTLTGPTSGTFTAGSTISIQWTDANVPSGSTISLAYDTTTNWGNPTWIEIGGVSATNGSGSYNWDTTGLAPGTYYLAGYLYTPSLTAVFSHVTTSFTVTG
ncbi:MAG: IPT/TIG domain-containing protein [Thermoguttaceae bacterium]